MAFILRKGSTLPFHLAGGLPGAGDDFSHTSHSLRVRAHHAEDAHVMENIFCGNGFRTDPGICKSYVFWDPLIQMVANHQHVQMLIQSIYCIRHGRVSRRGKYVGSCRCPDNVRGMAAAGAFCMVCMDSPSCNSYQSIFHTAAFVKSICMDGYLDVIVVGHVQAVVNGSRSRTPVFMKLQSHGSGFDLFYQSFLVRTVSFSKKTDVHRIFFTGF